MKQSKMRSEQKVKNIMLANINVFAGCMMPVLLDVQKHEEEIKVE